MQIFDFDLKNKQQKNEPLFMTSEMVRGVAESTPMNHSSQQLKELQMLNIAIFRIY